MIKNLLWSVATLFAGAIGVGPAAAQINAAIATQNPPAEFHVAPAGNNANPGTREKPFASIERARDAIRALKKQDALPAGGVAVVIHGGMYRVTHTFELASEDSGSGASPIIYRAAANETPVFSGGAQLRQFEPVKDEAILSRLPENARRKVVQVNLRACGVSGILPLEFGGFGSGRGFKTHPAMELFFNGEPLPLARWPNDGFVTITDVTTNAPVVSHGIHGSKSGLFIFQNDRPRRWQEEKDIWLYGYWFWDWADSYERVAKIDTDKQQIALVPPLHGYGYRKGQKFYALNLLSEIDQPGEWYLDRNAGVLYFWPPSDPANALVEISTAPFTFVELQNASHVRLQGLTFDLGSADAISITGGSDCLLAGCKIKRFAGSGISINGGLRHGVLSCDLFSLGRGGVSISGGDRKTLRPGGHFVENCHIHDLSRIDHTYTPAVHLSGVGHRVAHNLLHHIRSSAINLSGNDHLVEFNEVSHVVQESDDQGGVDMWGDPTYRGNVFHGNYFHHIGFWKNARSEPPLGQAGIRLDDAICGVHIYGNIFRHAATGKIGFGGVQIHGGKENILEDNLFADCATAVSFSPWNESHWLEFTKNFVSSKDIDFALYTNRYPGLARLNEGLNVNDLRRNQFVNCQRVFLRNRKESAAEPANVEINQDPALERELTSFSPDKKPSSEPLRRARIPLQEIGLYGDAWRLQLPSALVNQLRSDE